MSFDLMKPPASKPRSDCPWRRCAPPGWLGPFGADDWIRLAHSDEPIACHLTIVEDESFTDTRACTGAAMYRANVSKIPRRVPLGAHRRRERT